ncbi:MAG: YicC/YloC family endoribonuclease [Bosea sp. (in: a-proteobacteria)]
MAIQSMTGFARQTGTLSPDMAAFAWELKSVNGRGLDVRVRVPAGLDAIGDEARKRLSAAFQRGTIHASLTISTQSGAARPRINHEVLAGLLADLEQVKRPAGMGAATLDGLLAARGVIDVSEESVDRLETGGPVLLDALEQAIAALVASRGEEGAALETVVTGQIAQVEQFAKSAEHHPARQSEALKARLAAQVEALLEASQKLDPQRLHQEAALLVVKADIREEIDRLAAHVVAARALLAQGGAIGRKLDFLSQEFGREASTLCAKASDADLSRIGLDLRTVVDQMREQIQNVE